MKFSSMCSMSGEDSPKSKVFFDAINNAVKNDWMDWENVLSVSLDNTNTNMGEHKSLKSRFHTENPETFIAGCYCHSTHIVACNGGQGYCSATGFECEEYQWTCFTFLKTGIWNLLDQSGKILQGSYRLDGFHKNSENLSINRFENDEIIRTRALTQKKFLMKIILGEN